MRVIHANGKLGFKCRITPLIIETGERFAAQENNHVHIASKTTRHASSKLCIHVEQYRKYSPLH